MMHPALWKLRRLLVRAALRRLGRAMLTPQGAVVGVLGLCFLSFMVANAFITSASMGDSLHSEILPVILAATPLVLLVMTLISVFTSAGDKVISFSPSEVDLLFAGPFSRKQLLVYKLRTTIVGTAATALFLSITMMAISPWWLSAVCAIFFSILFIHAVTLVISLVGHTMAAAAFSRSRKIVAGLVIALFVLAAARSAVSVLEKDIGLALQMFVDSTAGTILLAPFHPFVELFRSETWSSAALWAAVCGAIDFSLLALAVRLDANYLESAVAASRRIDKLRQRAARSGAGALLTGSQKTCSWSLPRPPRAFGFGPAIWLQLSCGLRGSRSFMFFLALIVISAGVVAIALGHKGSANKFVGLSIGALGYLSFILAMNPPLGFRACGEQIPWLKTMPLSATAIGFGQTAGVALIVSSLQWLLLGLLFIGLKASVWFVWAAAIALPLNFLLFGLDNLAFLLFPSRLKSGAPGDVMVLGRMMFQSLIKMLSMTGVGIPAGVIGAVLWIWTKSFHAFPASALVTLILVDVGLVFLIALAFRRFDPSMNQIAS